VLCAGLAEAVARESVQTICTVWGVSRYTVRRWRQRLGVPRMNEGTRGLWRRLAKHKLTPAVRQRGNRASRRARATPLAFHFEPGRSLCTFHFALFTLAGQLLGQRRVLLAGQQSDHHALGLGWLQEHTQLLAQRGQLILGA